ncbi:MAG: hypothetical protein EXS08_02905 [Planctomycetes bacterium]|nr:hypothetical protein [Planctomycetota bacterium]
MRLGHLAIAVLVLVSCRSESATAACGSDVEPQSNSIPPAMPDRVPERYAFLYDWRAAEGITKEELAAALPYKRIELERSGCFGTCTAFLLQLARDGRATWEGRAYSEPGGTCAGTVGLVEFARICWFIEKLDLERVAGNYMAAWTDDQTTTIRLVKPGGEVIEFQDYGRQSPIEILALADLLELVARRNGWARKVEGEVSIDAVVLDVNRELEHVVLDKGLRDGMRIGYLFVVYLDSEFKGMVRVEEVLETTCSARIINEKRSISSGDSASMNL